VNRVAEFLNLIAWYWARLWHWALRVPIWGHVHVVQYVDDEPDQCKPGVLYVIEDAGRPWTAVMACPCGCGNALHMNLIADTQPVWALKIDGRGTPTLAPSVWRREGCRSHFVLRRGRIEWV
jgi:Family of unknown function (DUF6527)